jgi:hypothetical protein
MTLSTPEDDIDNMLTELIEASRKQRRTVDLERRLPACKHSETIPSDTRRQPGNLEHNNMYDPIRVLQPPFSSQPPFFIKLERT